MRAEGGNRGSGEDKCERGEGWGNLGELAGTSVSRGCCWSGRCDHRSEDKVGVQTRPLGARGDRDLGLRAKQRLKATGEPTQTCL